MEAPKRKAESNALVEMAPPKVPRADNQLVGVDPETKKQLMAAVRLIICTLYMYFDFPNLSSQFTYCCPDSKKK